MTSKSPTIIRSAPLPLPPPPDDGVYYWCDRIPSHLKTRKELLLDHLQPRKGAPVHGLKRTIMSQKWRFGGSVETVSERLLEHYQDEARRGSLSDAEFRYLQNRGYAVESHLYDMADAEPL